MENQSVAGTIVATDPDLTDTLTFLLSGAGADNGLFQISPTTGALTFKSAPDYEGPHSHAYTVTVMATDSSSEHLASAPTTVTVTATDVNDNPPVFAAAMAPVSIAENTAQSTVIYTAHATDADSGPALAYALGGADAARFNINVATGEVTFKVSPDYEQPGSTANTNMYRIDVVASDTVHTATQSVSVTSRT